MANKLLKPDPKWEPGVRCFDGRKCAPIDRDKNPSPKLLGKTMACYDGCSKGDGNYYHRASEKKWSEFA